MSMNQQQLLLDTQHYVKQKLTGEGSGHDWWHVYRVWKTAQHIAQSENDADTLVIELAALLHDIADWKFNNGDDNAGPAAARQWLESQQVDEKTIQHVCDIILNLSYKGANVENKINTLEGQIVQDADRLDAIGAIGIARTFAYGGHANREMYDPEVKPQLHDSAESYKTSQGHTINHFYEKLLLLKDRMHTQSAKSLAQARHQYMKDFLNRFYQEWEGKL